MESRKALVIGIDLYPDQPLRNCVNDAEEVAAMLAMPEYGFEVQKLTDSDANRRGIKSELSALFQKKSTFTLFYFAGHGLATDIGTYLIPIDTDDVDIGIDLEFITRLIKLKLKEDASCLIILDCCHSGAANIRALPRLKARELTYRAIEKSVPQLGNGKVLIAACKPSQLAYEEPSLRHGVFTHYLLEGLFGDAADHEGKITVTSLYDHVSKRFEDKIGQTPVFKGDIIGRLVLGTGLTPRDRAEIPEYSAREIDAVGNKLINQYLALTSVGIEAWRDSGYKEASATLQPTLDWFEKQVEKFPKLQTRRMFGSAFATAKGKLADLGRLEVGFNTREGIVEAKLGSGTFGVVWQLRRGDGKQIAYKVYHPTDIDNTEKISRFSRGYRAMEQLDHPHIVRVNKFTRCPVGFTMDFIAGPNLRDFAAQKPTPAEILPQLITVGETLNHSHSRGVIHRDVKPENIIMEWEPGSEIHRPYLSDFDLAWFSTATQFTREALGSQFYAAPEQLTKPNSRLAHEKTTDVYAFGQLCFFFITRRDPVPMLSDNAYALNEELRTWRFEDPARKLVDIYKECTHQEPAKRIQDFREICDRLFDISLSFKETDTTKVFTGRTFARQLAFSIVGMAPERIVSDNSFYTTSGRNLVEISVSEGTQSNKVVFRIQSQSDFLVAGYNYREARGLINQRIDTALSKYRQAVRTSGQQGGFETFINVREVPLSMEGIEMCRPILMRVIDAIERG